jgi:hypothetical protein
VDLTAEVNLVWPLKPSRYMFEVMALVKCKSFFFGFSLREFFCVSSEFFFKTEMN